MKEISLRQYICHNDFITTNTDERTVIYKIPFIVLYDQRFEVMNISYSVSMESMDSLVAVHRIDDGLLEINKRIYDSILFSIRMRMFDIYYLLGSFNLSILHSRKPPTITIRNKEYLDTSDMFFLKREF